jgi:cytochrome c peroxidase
VHARFAAARAAYKRVEPLVELYLPTTADLINGPALDDMAEDDPTRTLPPEGFQVLEEALFPRPALGDTAQRGALRTETRILIANVRRVRDDAVATPLTDAAVFDAARLQLVRVFTLGLAGFDSPIALRALPEGAVALDGVRALLVPYDSALRRADGALADSLAARLAAAERALADGGDFERFDRLAFLVDHVRPLAGTLLRAQQALGIPHPPESRAWRAAAATPFEQDAFEAMYFAPVQRARTSAAEVALGRALFFEPALSRDGTRSCASCHQPARAFTDGRARSLDGPGAGPRRAATRPRCSTPRCRTPPSTTSARPRSRRRSPTW